MFEAQAHLFKIIYNYVSSTSLKCAVELDIPEVIHKHGRPITLPQLVSALEINPTKADGLFKLMRLLVHTGFFSTANVQSAQQQEEEAYALTLTSKLFLKDKPYCLSPVVLTLTDQVFVNPCHFLSRWFRDNELSAYETANDGTVFWDYMAKNPDFNSIYNQAMASDSQLANLIVKDCQPIFQGLGSLVDVGGGTGSFARIISEAFPGIKCTVLDLPHVVPKVPDTDNLKFIAGDMFQSIPPADAFFFKAIFHAFVDEDCLKILKRCREAIASRGDRGKVIIIDIVINEKKEDAQLTEAKLLYDMLMLVAVRGSERTEKEWEKLFLDAGFSHFKITPVYGIKSLIEVYP
ncbi:O-methyltransferase ZRP4 [Citrus sinensis]|nr:O-methyltransferase ZRP4 [Citrus sinensis]